MKGLAWFRAHVELFKLFEIIVVICSGLRCISSKPTWQVVVDNLACLVPLGRKCLANVHRHEVFSM